MYNFSRICFVFVLVLAVGFSFLLVCFVHTGRCQTDLVITDRPIPIPPIIIQTQQLESGPFIPTVWYNRALPYGWPGPNSVYPVGTNQLLALEIYYQPNGQSMFSGSTSLSIDRLYGLPIDQILAEPHPPYLGSMSNGAISTLPVSASIISRGGIPLLSPLYVQLIGFPEWGGSPSYPDMYDRPPPPRRIEIGDVVR